MVYNKTKRGLEKAAGIVGVVISALEIVVVLSYLIQLATLPAEYFYYFGEVVFAYIFVAGFAILNLVFSALVIKSPVQPDGFVKQRTGIRVCMLVFSILDGQWVTAGLMIAVLCLKDLKPVVQKPSQQVSASNAELKQETQKDDSIDSKVAELKHLKELGVLDDETYKKAVNKLLKDIL